MEVLIVLLLVPALGALLLLSEWQGRVAIGRDARRLWRLMLRAAGLLLLPIAVGLTYYAVQRFLEFDLIQSVLLIGRLILVGVLLWAGLRAVGVARLGDERELSARDAVLRSRPADELRMAAWALVAFPLLWLVLSALVLIAPLLYIVGVIATSRRGETGQLLWALAIGVEHRLNLADEVDALALAGSWRRRSRLLGLAHRLRDGTLLSDALNADPKLLPAHAVMAIRIGEQTGNLQRVLRDCALRDTADMRNAQADGSISALMSYYWVLSVVMIFVVSFLCIYIVPKLKEIFTDFGIELPNVTRRMVAFAEWIASFGWITLPLLAVPVTLLLLMAYAYLVGWSRMNVPMLMRWFPRRDAPGVLRGLAWAVDAGRPLPELVSDAAVHHPRRDIGLRLARIGLVMESGEEGWCALADEGFVTAQEVRALEAAGRMQHLPVALDALADSLDRARRHRLLWWIEWCKPFVILMFGWLVAFYSLAFFMPIVDLIEALL